jgi:hypothetical protein
MRPKYHIELAETIAQADYVPLHDRRVEHQCGRFQFVQLHGQRFLRL